MEDLPFSSVLRWANKHVRAEVGCTGRASGLSEQLTCRLMQNDPKDKWWKGRTVFSPAIKGISLVIDMAQVLVSWHVDCCLLDPHVVVGAKPKSSRTSGTSLSSQFLSSLFRCQQLRPQATSLHACVAQRHTIRVKMMPFTCACRAPTALHLGSGLFFEEI